MVLTRHLASSPVAPTASDDASKPEAATSTTPASAKVSREMRKLLIDGEAALGGSGSLKRKRRAPRASITATFTSPAYETPITFKKEPVEDTAPALSTLPQAILPQQAAISSHHQEQAGKVADLPNGVSMHAPTTPTQASRNEQSSRKSDFWFLPDDGTAPSSPPPRSATKPRSPLPSSTVIPPRHRATSPSSTSADAKPRPLVASPLLESPERHAHEPQHPEANQTPSKKTRKRKQFTKVVRDLRGSKDEGPLDVSGHVPQHNLSIQQAAGPDANSAPSTENKAVNRALKKLKISANESLGGNPFAPANAPRSNRAARREPHALARVAREHAIKQRQARPPKSKRSRGPIHLDTFPANPAPEMVDHVLLLLAEAAQEYDLVRALNGDARQAIMRDVRHENPYVKEDRMQRELAVMESWNLVPEPEASRFRAMMATAPEKSKPSTPVPAADDGGALENTIPDADPAASMSASSNRELASNADNDHFGSSRRTSQTSQPSFWTPPAEALPADNSREVDMVDGAWEKISCSDAADEEMHDAMDMPESSPASAERTADLTKASSPPPNDHALEANGQAAEAILPSDEESGQSPEATHQSPRGQSPGTNGQLSEVDGQLCSEIAQSLRVNGQSPKASGQHSEASGQDSEADAPAPEANGQPQETSGQMLEVNEHTTEANHLSPEMKVRALEADEHMPKTHGQVPEPNGRSLVADGHTPEPNGALLDVADEMMVDDATSELLPGVTRILEPDNDGAIPADRWKGKRKEHSDQPVDRDGDTEALDGETKSHQDQLEQDEQTERPL